MRMQDKTAVIVRGLSPLGTEAAEAFVREGASGIVIIDSADSDRSGFDRLKKECGEKIMLQEAEVNDAEAIKAAMAEAAGRLSKIDTLVNCQDVRGSGGLMDITEADWNRVLTENLTGLFFSCRAAVPWMKQRRYGRIVNLTSMASRCYDGSDIAYGASKTGTAGFTRGLAMELREQGITVNSVAVGKLEQEHIMKAAVHAIIYLAGDEAGWTTGDCMDVNAGAFMQN